MGACDYCEMEEISLSIEQHENSLEELKCFKCEAEIPFLSKYLLIYTRQGIECETKYCMKCAVYLTTDIVKKVK